jgi:hypothetical protein
MAKLGRLPRLGDEVLVPTPGANWRLSVVGLDGRRVSRVALFTGPTAGEFISLTTPATAMSAPGMSAPGMSAPGMSAPGAATEAASTPAAAPTPIPAAAMDAALAAEPATVR